jgi:hypothetical protein
LKKSPVLRLPCGINPNSRDLFIAGEDSVNESSKADTSSNESLLDDGKIVAIVTLTQVGSLDVKAVWVKLIDIIPDILERLVGPFGNVCDRLVLSNHFWILLHVALELL